jgi:two-component system chemotaxis response regulator CheY
MGLMVEALLIDDSPVALRVIRHHLQQIGCRIVGEAENAWLGLKLFQELKPQLVTLDLIMPAVEGIDAIQAFRSIREESPRTQIIVVSAVPFERTRRGMVDEGALAYIVKPFTKFSFDQARVRLQRVFPELTRR